MTRKLDKKQIQVRGHWVVGPYISLPASQLTAMKKLLDQHDIGYDVHNFLIPVNSRKEPMAVLNLDRSKDLERVQELVDSLEELS